MHSFDPIHNYNAMKEIEMYTTNMYDTSSMGKDEYTPINDEDKESFSIINALFSIPDERHIKVKNSAHGSQEKSEEKINQWWF